jgi:hypothetical protein
MLGEVVRMFTYQSTFENEAGSVKMFRRAWHEVKANI